MKPLVNHLPIRITNNVITMANPNKHFYGFAIYYRVYPFRADKTGSLPVRLWLPMGQHKIELIKKVWFWHTWIQYAQWMQDFEIKTQEPISSLLVRKQTLLTSTLPMTIS